MPKPVKYCRFREVVKDLIGVNASKSEMIAIQSKLIEYAAKGDYAIYAQVLCCDWEQEFRITKEDLYCLARTPRVVLNIEELRLYGTANSALYDYYYKRVEADEEGIIHDCPDVSRTYPIAKDSLLISEDDIPLLKETIGSGNLDLNTIPVNVKAEKKSVESDPLFMDDAKNILYFNKGSLVNIRPDEINLIKYMQKQEAFELEQILTDHFKIKLSETFRHKKDIAEAISLSPTKPTIEKKSKPVSKGDRNKFDTYKSNINRKCRPLEIGDLIEKHPNMKKTFKLTKKITRKTYSHNAT